MGRSKVLSYRQDGMAFFNPDPAEGAESERSDDNDDTIRCHYCRFLILFNLNCDRLAIKETTFH